MLQLHLLGVPGVMRAGQPVAGAAAQPRRLAILALVAQAGRRGITRDKLVATLWSDSDDEKGRRALTHALYALRRDLEADEVIDGSDTLRLDDQLMASDVQHFTRAQAEGRFADAAAVYDGPFMDGFHVPDAPEFERWLDEERSALCHSYARLLESLARDAVASGDAHAACQWWRRRSAEDPLNGRIAIALMEALERAGDRAGALRQAQIYEALVRQELALPPDREVVAFAQRLRANAAPPRIALGYVADYREAGSAPSGPLTDLLATSLASLPGVSLVGMGRLHEVRRDMADAGSGAAALVSAAREAGATQVIEGAVYSLPAGNLRLDVRRTDLSSGQVLGAYRVEAADVFALADRVIALLARDLGGSPALS